MEFRLLGPLQVWAGGRELAIGGAQRKALLAVLLLHANQVVPSERIAALLWGQDRPKTARSALRWQLSQLRRALGEVDGGRLAFRSPGYRLRVEDGELDLDRFRQLADQGRQALAAGDAERGAELLRAALSLWRGRALEDVDVPELLARQAQLEQRRLAALEDRVDADLQLGRHGDLVAELEALAAGEPLRERLSGQLMVALYRCGRRAGALAAFQALRDRLVAELGIEPGRPLQELQRRILAADPTLDKPAPEPPRARSVVPRQLPPDVAAFTGRERELATLEQRLAGSAGPGPVAVVAVHGAGGAGKSALAIHAAHRLAERYPDGQLYVNLHGATPGLAPLAPAEVLGRFLRALGVPGGEVPAAVEEAAARYRSEVAGRRLLVILDNAAGASQVAPLLPGAPTCAALVTSRRLPSGLDGATALRLGALTPPEAVGLLGRLAGEGRVAAEPGAAAEVARWCGHLPLALRIAGVRLATRPGWPLSALAGRLADSRRRLEELELPDVGMKASFEVSYRELRAGADPLDRATAEAFELVGLLEGPDFAVPAVARLLDRPEPHAERAVERLVDSHLLETPAPGRYRLHDLLRLYAREVAAQRHPEERRSAALGRVLDDYAATAWQTLALLRAGDRRLTRAPSAWAAAGQRFAGPAAALAWLDAERSNLVAAAIAPASPGRVACQLADALFAYFTVRGHHADWARVNQAALAAARRAGDRAAEAQACNDLGVARFSQGRYDQAQALFKRSLALRRSLGDRPGQADGLNNLGLVHERQGRGEQAFGCYEASLALFDELGDRHGFAVSLNNLGGAHRQLGRPRQALGCLERSAALFGELGDDHGRAESLCGLGMAYQRLGRPQAALGPLERSRALRHQLGDRAGVAESLRETGLALRALGRHAEARAHWERALALAEQLPAGGAARLRALLAGDAEGTRVRATS